MQPDGVRLAIKTGIANYRCSADLKEETLPRKTNPQFAGAVRVAFTRGWRPHLSLPRVTSPPPRCPSPHHPRLRCPEPGPSIPLSIPPVGRRHVPGWEDANPPRGRESGSRGHPKIWALPRCPCTQPLLPPTRAQCRAALGTARGGDGEDWHAWSHSQDLHGVSASAWASPPPAEPAWPLK